MTPAAHGAPVLEAGDLVFDGASAAGTAHNIELPGPVSADLDQSEVMVLGQQDHLGAPCQTGPMDVYVKALQWVRRSVHEVCQQCER